MISVISKRQTTLSYRILSAFIAIAFIFSLIVPPTPLSAQVVSPALLDLPLPGAMISLSSSFNPPIIQGVTINPENPLKFNFLISSGDHNLEGDSFREESTKLIKYFLAGLTVPDEELWVNLSPYEKDRVISGKFGQTEMGRDMLAQDYILKQLTASLMYPENELGKKFWDRVYKQAYERYGTTEIPMNTFNKIWIVPDKAVVYEHDQTAFVVESHLKVMLEEDYVALQNNLDNTTHYALGSLTKGDAEIMSGVSSEIVREILIPEIEKEVNEGEIFTQLRQIYNSVILATWYKKNLRESLLGQVYVDKGKTKGVDFDDKEANQKIYQRYVEAFEKGVYNYIKEDYDPVTRGIIPRKYFSGGNNLSTTKRVLQITETIKPNQLPPSSSPVRNVQADLLEASQSNRNEKYADNFKPTESVDLVSSPVESRPLVQVASSSPVIGSDQAAVTVTEQDFQEIVQMRSEGKAGFHRNIDPTTRVIPAQEGVVLNWLAVPPDKQDEFSAKEAQMYREGKITMIVMAGGEATRFGGPKTFVKVSDDLGEFLGIKAANLRWVHQKFGTDVPMYLLSSEKRLPEFKQALADRNYYGLNPEDFLWYTQGTIDTFIPTDEEIEANFKGDAINKHKAYAAALRKANPDGIYRINGQRRKVPSGHFDAIASFIISGRLTDALERGIEYAPVVNIDNLKAILKNKGLIAHFAESGNDFGFILAEKNMTATIRVKSTGKVLTDKLIVRFVDNIISFDGITEFYDKAEKDGIQYVINQNQKTVDVYSIATEEKIDVNVSLKAETGGTLVQLVDSQGRPVGKPIMKEGFELNKDFPHERAPYFNTNTIIVNLRHLLRFLDVTQEQLAGMNFEERSELVRNKLVKQIKPNFEFKNDVVDGEYPELGVVENGRTKIAVSQLTRIMLQVAHLEGANVNYYTNRRSAIFAPVKEPEDRIIAATNNRSSLRQYTVYKSSSNSSSPVERTPKVVFVRESQVTLPRSEAPVEDAAFVRQATRELIAQATRAWEDGVPFEQISLVRSVEESTSKAVADIISTPDNLEIVLSTGDRLTLSLEAGQTVVKEAVTDISRQGQLLNAGDRLISDYAAALKTASAASSPVLEHSYYGDFKTAEQRVNLYRKGGLLQEPDRGLIEDLKAALSFTKATLKNPAKNVKIADNTSGDDKTTFGAVRLPDGSVVIERTFLNEINAKGNPLNMRLRVLVHLLTEGTPHEKRLAEYNYAKKAFPLDVANLLPEKGVTVEDIWPRIEQNLLGLSIDDLFKGDLGEPFKQQVKNHGYEIREMDQEKRKLTAEVGRRAQEALYKMAVGIMNKDINPRRKVRLQESDAPFTEEEIALGRLKMGVLPLAANPMTLAHLLIAGLQGAAEAQTDRYFFSLTRADFRDKPELLLTYLKRIEIAGALIRKSSGGLLDLMPMLDIEMDPAKVVNGEEKVLPIMEFNKDINLTVFYGAGGDHYFSFVRSKGKVPLVREMTPDNAYYPQLPGYRALLRQLVDAEGDKFSLQEKDFLLRVIESPEDVAPMDLVAGSLNGGLPQLDVVGKLYLIQQELKSRKEKGLMRGDHQVVMLKTGRGADQPDSLRDALGVPVVHNQGVELDVSSTRFRQALIKALLDKVIYLSDFAGTPVEVLQQILLMSEESGVEYARILLQTQSGKNSKTLDKTAANALQDVLAELGVGVKELGLPHSARHLVPYGKQIQTSQEMKRELEKYLGLIDQNLDLEVTLERRDIILGTESIPTGYSVVSVWQMRDGQRTGDVPLVKVTYAIREGLKETRFSRFEVVFDEKILTDKKAPHYVTFIQSRLIDPSYNKEGYELIDEEEGQAYYFDDLNVTRTVDFNKKKVTYTAVNNADGKEETYITDMDPKLEILVLLRRYLTGVESIGPVSFEELKRPSEMSKKDDAASSPISSELMNGLWQKVENARKDPKAFEQLIRLIQWVQMVSRDENKKGILEPIDWISVNQLSRNDILFVGLTGKDWQAYIVHRIIKDKVQVLDMLGQEQMIDLKSLVDNKEAVYMSVPPKRWNSIEEVVDGIRGGWNDFKDLWIALLLEGAALVPIKSLKDLSRDSVLFAQLLGQQGPHLFVVNEIKGNMVILLNESARVIYGVPIRFLIDSNALHVVSPSGGGTEVSSPVVLDTQTENIDGLKIDASSSPVGRAVSPEVASKAAQIQQFMATRPNAGAIIRQMKIEVGGENPVLAESPQEWLLVLARRDPSISDQDWQKMINIMPEIQKIVLGQSSGFDFVSDASLMFDGKSVQAMGLVSQSEDSNKASYDRVRAQFTQILGEIFEEKRIGGFRQYGREELPLREGTDVWVKAGRYAYRVWTSDSQLSVQGYLDREGARISEDGKEPLLSRQLSWFNDKNNRVIIGTRIQENAYRVVDDHLSPEHFSLRVEQRPEGHVLVIEDLWSVGGTGIYWKEQVVSSSSPTEEGTSTADFTKGGIDFNPALLDLQIKRDGNGVALPMDLQPIEVMNIEGFLPVIINITPVVNLPLLLGLETVDDGQRPVNSADVGSPGATRMDLGWVDKYRRKYIREGQQEGYIGRSFTFEHYSVIARPFLGRSNLSDIRKDCFAPLRSARNDTNAKVLIG